MSLRKPYRICNDPVQEIFQVQTYHPACTTAFLTEQKTQYELRIHLPGYKKETYTIDIYNGVLYIRNGISGKRDIITRLLLPANVQQKKIRAFYRRYGIKILMPKAPSNALLLHIPIN